MPKVPYPYEVNGKLVTGNGSLIPICSLSNRSLLPSLTVLIPLISTMVNGTLLNFGKWYKDDLRVIFDQCFHSWDYLTNIWCNNLQSIIDVVENLAWWIKNLQFYWIDKLKMRPLLYLFIDFSGHTISVWNEFINLKTVKLMLD